MIDSIDLTEKTTGDLGGVDAKKIAAAIGPNYLEYIRRSVTSSTDPETGRSKKPLSPRATKEPRAGGRGYRTGELARGLTLRVTGNGAQANLVVKVPDSRWFFLAVEASRGVLYLSADGLAEDMLSRAVSEVLADG